MTMFVVKNEKEEMTIEGLLRGKGKVEAKKQREKKLIPACLYGKDTPNIEFSINVKDAEKLRIGQIVKIKVDNNLYKSVVKEIQYDYLKDKTLHVDFLSLIEGRFIEIEVPLEIRGESPGVKAGGVLQVLLNKLTIKVTPDNIPDKIIIDISNLNIGDSIHVSNLIEKFKDIKFVDRGDTAIVTITHEEETTEESKSE